MIRSIEIKGLRGIREGKLDDLAPLSILVGPNGSGKSTVLDALLIGASPTPVGAIVRAVARRVGVKRAARWLFWRAGGPQPCEVSVISREGEHRRTTLAMKQEDAADQFTVRLLKSNSAEVQFGMTIDFENKLQTAAYIAMGAKIKVQEPWENHTARLNSVPSVGLVDAKDFETLPPLYRTFTATVEQGRDQDVKKIAGEALRGLSDIRILTEGDTPVLHLVFPGYSIPVGLAGDGVQTVLRLSLELASCSGGVVLLEEPEVHQHPGTVRLTAMTILAAVRRGIQVILTTHSLELIDGLLTQASEEDLKQIAVFRVQLEDGVLKSSRLPGPDAAFARSQIEEDLR